MGNVDIPFLGQVATQGILGVLLALSIFANWYQFKVIQTINEKRVADQVDTRNKVMDALSQIKTNGDLLISLFQKFLNNGNNGGR